jgi:hypothetical protein
MTPWPVYFLCRIQSDLPESDGHGLFSGAPNGCKALRARQVTPASAGAVSVVLHHINNAGDGILSCLGSRSINEENLVAVSASIIE